MSTTYRVPMTQAQYDAYMSVPTNIIPSNYSVFISDAPIGTPNLYSGTGTTTPVAGIVGGGTSAANTRKVQITAVNTALSEDESGKYSYFHIEAGGSIATVTTTHIPIPASGVKKFTIQNHSGAEKTIAFTIGIGQFQGVVDFQGNQADNNVILTDNMTVDIFVDEDGFVQATPSYNAATQAELDAVSGTVLAHGTNVSNPHSVTASQVGLGLVNNTADTAKPVSTAQQTALNLKQDASTAATDAELTAHTGNVSNPHTVTKSQVGLGSAENTSDASKPVSTATQTALDGKSATSHAHTGTYEPADATILKEAEVVNTLVGTATNLPLSAAQGKALQDGKRALYSLGHPYHTAATEAGHIVTGTSQFNADYAPWKALQASPAALSEWATANASSASLTYQLPQATVFNRVVLMGRLNGIEYPTTWSIEGSNDGTTYTTLVASHTESLQTEVTKDFTNTTAYKYYRFSYTAVVGTNVGLNHIRYYHTGINYLPTLPINNTLTSTSTTDALSAAQGKVLQDVKSDTTYVDTGLTSKQKTLDAIARRWTPNQDLVTGMQVMFRPEELPTTGTVTAWNDVSGNARNLSQGGTSSPSVSGVLLNGLPVVQFATANDRLTTAALPALHGVDSTMFVVFEHPAAAVSAELMGQNDANGRCAYISPKWSDNNLYVDYGNAAGSRISLANSPFVGDEVFHILSARRSGTTSGEVWRNGTSVVVDNTLDTPAAFAANSPFLVGSAGGAGNESFAGKIAEIIIYNTALTAAAREQIEGYLAHKYGLQANLPAGHTYRNAVPTVNYHIHSVADSGLQTTLDGKQELYEGTVALRTPSNLTSNTSDSRYILTASSEHTVHLFYRAFDNNDANHWYTAGVSVANAVIELNYKIRPTNLLLKGETTGSEYWIRWQLQGSKDGINWDILIDRSGVDEAIQSASKNFPITTSKEYKYFRFNGLNAVGTNIPLSRLEISGVEPAKDFTNWTTYTPVVTSESGGWTSYTASGRYRIIDRMLTVSFRIQFTGTPGAASGLYVSIPSGLTMNNNVMTGGAGWDSDLVGFGIMGDSGVISGVPAIINTRTTQKVLVKYYNAAGAYLTCAELSNTAPWTWAINDTIDGQFVVPIT